MKRIQIGLLSLFLVPSVVLGQKIEVDDTGTSKEAVIVEPRSGEREAQKYMRKKETREPERSVADEDHYLGLHIGSYLNADAYRWSDRKDPATNAGGLNLGLTYRVGPFTSLADWAFRADFLFYNLPEGKPVMLSILPLIMFPESSSKFPVYFGLGAGAGVYFQQVNSKSYLALTYQMVIGCRFFDVMGSTGFFIEGGLKNHLHLLSEGQLNGSFLAVGTLFTF